MNIDIMTLLHFKHLNIEAKRGQQNAGGGMACLMNAVKATLSTRYCVNLIEGFDEISSDFIILDSVMPTNKIVKKEDGIHNYTPDEVIQLFIKELTDHKTAAPDRKFLLWCAEKSFFRWKPKDRDKILSSVDLLAVTDPYLSQLMRAVEITPNGYLCDCIHSDLFRPAPKTLSVIAVGALKHIKNIDWVLDIYARLEGTGVKRIYLGGASLWSHENRQEDHALIEEIEKVTDVYLPNASVAEVAYHNAHAAFTVNNTWHDCSSRSNEELLMSGVISIHGEHPLFNGRPGFKVKTSEEAVEKIDELTDGFTQLPDPKLHEKSRNWALKNVSEAVFLNQFENLTRYVL